MQGQRLKMLIDSGATHSIVRRDLLAAPAGTQYENIQARDFEGRLSTTTLRKISVDTEVEKRFCPVELVEWPLRQDFDGILGQTELRRENPDIDWSADILSWRSAPRRSLPREWKPPPLPELEIGYVDAEEFLRNLTAGMYAEVFHLDVLTEALAKKQDVEVQRLVKAFADYLLEELAEGLPPERDIEHAAKLRQGAVPSSRPSFGMPMSRKTHLCYSWTRS